MRTRLVSFLGLGPEKAKKPFYSPAVYELDGQLSVETPLLERALLDLVPGIESIVVLGTARVRERWMDSRLLTELVGREAWFVEVPQASSEEDRWRLFVQVVQALKPSQIEEAGEIETPQQIVLDVTHGFRAQPLLGMAAVAYVLSEWVRQEVAEPPALRLLYGAWEARDEGTNVAPIWDLTELVKASRWNAALDALMRYGRADDLERLGAEERRSHLDRLRSAGKTGKELGEASFAGTLGLAAKELADDLALGRLRDLVAGAPGRKGKGKIGSARRLRDLVTSPEADDLQRRLPPLRDSLQQLDRLLAPLEAPNVLGREGLVASAALVGLYGRLQRFAEQAALIREGLVSCHALATNPAGVVEPGGEGCLQAREAPERDLGKLDIEYRCRLDDLPEPQQQLIKLWGEVSQLRNDIEHCGIRGQPVAASRLRQALEKISKEFVDLVSRASSEATANIGPAQKRAAARFLNLSNHPLSRWTAEQRQAARALDLGEPADLDGGMPLVDPEADERKVCALADEIAERARRQGTAGAFVASEPTLTLALVSRLQRAGVRCFNATTAREAEATVAPDGSVHRESTFRFVKWRPYPELGR